ncbi:hypothetical protein [Brevundimonas sp. SORGH_AS_0993]|uniref:hypothetical protein n=1 Tax=Brevundimonas sp. SORGH_AS_0993 TaxID=3041794 RepID=UPI0027849807|nr:hypothetical protein [Brevundimonas sp. SORGH_AS_0993]MDQ1154169.1 putative membrane protein [Brevundimonas sp. SORGH_AS_0993]
MSMTYTNAEAEARTQGRAEPAAFVPRYARHTRSKKAVKTWMILAPLGAIVLLGSGVAMMLNSDDQAAPAPMDAAPAMQTAPAAIDATQTPAAPAAMTPTASETPAPTRQDTVARRADVEPHRAPPRSTRATTERPAAPVETPTVSSGPQPYSAPATVRLNAPSAAPTVSTATSAPTVQTPPPVIVVQPTD